jgi:hypothetical protein
VRRDAVRYERGVVASLETFGAPAAGDRARLEARVREVEALLRPAPAPPPAGDGALVFTRAATPVGPMSGFGYDYFEDKFGAARAGELALLRHAGDRGAGADYAYEALNLVDGRRPASEIRDILSAQFGPVPLDAVVGYLRALAEIGVLAAR